MAAATKIGVIGLGIGVSAQIPCLQVEGFEVVAVAAAHKEKAEEAAKRLNIPAAYGDYRQLLEHPGLEAVSVATPPLPHHEIVLAALAAGKHVLVEKPFAANEKHAREMMEKAKASSKTAMIAQPYRFTPARAYVKELLQEGYAGNARSVVISYFNGPREKRSPGPVHWRMSEAQGGGVLLGPGSTLFDSILDWFGPVTDIAGRIFVHEQERTQPDGTVAKLADSDDGFSASFTLRNGAWGAVNFSSVAPYGPGGRIDIFGSEGMLQINQAALVPTGGDTVFGARFAGGPQVKQLPIPEKFQLAPDPRDPKTDPQKAYRYVIRRFAEGIRTGTSPSTNFEDAYRVQRMLEAIKQSGRSGRWVKLN